MILTEGSVSGCLVKKTLATECSISVKLDTGRYVIVLKVTDNEKQWIADTINATVTGCVVVSHSTDSSYDFLPIDLPTDSEIVLLARQAQTVRNHMRKVLFTLGSPVNYAVEIEFKIDSFKKYKRRLYIKQVRPLL